jgi:hypothetical protein
MSRTGGTGNKSWSLLQRGIWGLGSGLLVAFVAASPCAAASVVINTDTGAITVDGVAVDNLGGTFFAVGAVQAGVRSFYFNGDLRFGPADRVTGVGSAAISFIVRNDVEVAPGAVFDFSAIGALPGPGGGAGGGGGDPATLTQAAIAGAGGAGSAGGAGGLGGAPAVVAINANGSTGGSASAAGGANGRVGMLGAAGQAGALGVNNPGVGSGGAAGTAGQGGAGAEGYREFCTRSASSDSCWGLLPETRASGGAGGFATSYPPPGSGGETFPAKPGQNANACTSESGFCFVDALAQEMRGQGPSHTISFS